MAITPMTATCWRINEKFWPVKNRSDWKLKKTHAAIKAINGPSTEIGGKKSFTRRGARDWADLAGAKSCFEPGEFIADS
jgi:hypothetical protein